MKNILKEALLNQGWEINFNTENDEYLNINFGIIKLYEKGLTYKVNNIMDMHFQYSDIVRVENNSIVLENGTLSI